MRSTGGHDVSAGEDTNILSYDDAFEISEYAIPAMQWACAEGLIEGLDASTLSPNGSATRAQSAAILMRLLENAAN
ncbi:MAG: S-layer homology domain-containing protein [Oscillospiraceae bacterium]|nr:S-layer homology domain-containing protein [Oscillospiraceae bacterium]